MVQMARRWRCDFGSCQRLFNQPWGEFNGSFAMSRVGFFVTSALAAALLTACAAPPAGPATVVYTCDDGNALRVQFEGEAALVTLPDGNTLRLPQQPAASGIWYATPQYTLRGKGDDATWTIGRRAPMACRVQRP
jgi:membrane-bound inhibitor of C-type lysozyme